MKLRTLALGLIALGAPGAALATETITYTYDHQGRLTKAARAGDINDGVSAQYWYDKADNRTRMKVVVPPHAARAQPPKPKP
jgi:N-acetyl-beta-hexosaminidase